MNSKYFKYTLKDGTVVHSGLDPQGHAADWYPVEHIVDENTPKDLSYGIKDPISLVPPTFIRQVSRCMKDGAIKRSPYNYRKEPVSAMQLLDKILRHTLDAVDGKDLTDDSKLSNLASAAADIAVYLDAQEHGTLVDDRPKHNG